MEDTDTRSHLFPLFCSKSSEGEVSTRVDEGIFPSLPDCSVRGSQLDLSTKSQFFRFQTVAKMGKNIFSMLLQGNTLEIPLNFW